MYMLIQEAKIDVKTDGSDTTKITIANLKQFTTDDNYNIIDDKDAYLITARIRYNFEINRILDKNIYRTNYLSVILTVVLKNTDSLSFK